MPEEYILLSAVTAFYRQALIDYPFHFGSLSKNLFT